MGGTLYYEDDKFSVRGSATYRDKYLLSVPTSRIDTATVPGTVLNDVQGAKSTVFVDAVISYQVTPQISVRLEGQNLTNEAIEYYYDSVRQDPYYTSFTGRKFTAGVAFKFGRRRSGCIRWSQPGLHAGRAVSLGGQPAAAGTQPRSAEMRSAVSRSRSRVWLRSVGWHPSIITR